MPVYPTLTHLIADMSMSPLTRGEDFVGRTRLGSFFQDSWLKQPYGTTPSDNKIIAPGFQRDATAWKLEKKRDFMRKIIRGVSSLGNFIHLNLRTDGTLVNLDSQHRLTTVQGFIDGRFNLGKKSEVYEKCTDEQKEKIHNTIVDVKIYYHYTLEEERDEYFRLNSNVPLSSDARLHAHRNDTPQPVFQWCEIIRENRDNNISIARLRELTQIGSVSLQVAEKRLLPIISLLVSGKSNTAKECHATLAALPVPADMAIRIEHLASAVMSLDSSNNALTKFIGPAAYDIHENWGNESELNGCIARWSALIERCKTHPDAYDESLVDVKRPGREATTKFLNQRCERIRELYDENGNYIGA